MGGQNIFLGEGIVIYTIRPDLLTIGHNTLITSRCMILTHFYKNGNFYYGDVKIGSGCFIGMNTIIANSVRIGDNSVIGTGSIVTKDAPAGEVWAGNPAKFIKKTNLINFFLYEKTSCNHRYSRRTCSLWRF